MNKSKKILILTIAFIIIFSFTSCSNSNNPIKDDFKFELIVEAKEDYITSVIRKTLLNNVLVYKTVDQDKTTYVKYTFENNSSKTKIIYSFYDNIDDFRSNMKLHENHIDGYYSEVKEDILLICTMFDYIDAVKFNELKDKVSIKFEIIE